jgi:hypothetical protein
MPETEPHGDLAFVAQSTARLGLRNADDQVAHVVCCREPEWRVALCGEPGDSINLTPQMVCTMCLEIVLQRLPSFFDNDPTLCPMDHRPCPDEHEVDLRILREVTDS